MLKVHSICETVDGLQGYVQSPHFYFYYLVTPMGVVTYEERYRVQAYSTFTYFKKIVMAFDRYCVFLRPPLEMPELDYDKLINYYHDNGL